MFGLIENVRFFVKIDMDDLLIQALMGKEGSFHHDPLAVIALGEQLLELSWREPNTSD